MAGRHRHRPDLIDDGRDPSPEAIHGPDRIAGTDRLDRDLASVAIFVPRARQIGHGGGPLGSCLSMWIVPSDAIVPTAWVMASDPLGFGAVPLNRASKVQPLAEGTNASPRSIFRS